MSESTQTRERQIASFHLGDMLLGIDLSHIHEINRLVDVTPVPHAFTAVRGVINLRGDVVSVVDLRAILGLPPLEVTKRTRNVIVNSRDERIGLLVDRIADVVSTTEDTLLPPPANLSGIDGRFFDGVFANGDELMVILNVEETLADENTSLNEAA